VAEVGGGEARVGGHADQAGAGRVQAALQLEREQQVRQLRLRVRPGGGVPALAHEVVEVHPAAVVQAAAHGHHAGVRAGEQRRQQQRGEREVAQVVGAELALEPVDRALARQHHHARVVHQQVDGGEIGGEPAYRREVGEVERCALDGGPGDGGQDPLTRGLAACGVAGGDHDAGAVAGEFGGGGQPDAAVGPGDDGGTAGQVGDLVGGPVSHGARR
jgi:hypothetical protein